MSLICLSGGRKYIPNSVSNLWVKLDGVDGFGFVTDGSERGIASCGDSMEPIWELSKLIAVRHPHTHIILKPFLNSTY